ncbi:cytochrome bd-I ubiquinol oxidase subunit 2 apoprotein [Sulfitobacter brevis]|jgi:cytochrome d ubiquinol oxidase subunit II|uniref:Cytochrome bd-I ubiquinol oxidase subunit 2 apoprotein n=1 Tax=Sulfitobacter brevis TaxID=74348 RepID=A0A1I2GS71_9RHOB|nr:cytochrome d ubiquinol oxidase subunit II [Sulfitobacter brevis]SFF19401.1 cytochrome bd-I ubiquinol oxidase subunit 2 apoprotein [Sulfitobacter brevis]
MEVDLSVIWAGLIAFSVLAYVLLDGFDLGIGILFPFLKDRDERHLAMNTIAPIWDGNQTWLVLGGGGLFAVFPLAYAIVMSALYPLIIAMLLGLIFRGVAFEFVHRTKRMQGFWEFGFWSGSLIAAIAQGMALGALVQGIAVEGRAYSGGNWDWLTPFSVLTALAVLVGYAMLGATWLILKTEGETLVRARRFAIPLGVGLIALIGVVSLVTPFLLPDYLARWFGWPSGAWTAIMPILLALAVWQLWAGLRNWDDLRPFLATVAIFVLSYAGLGISLYPHLVPPALTIAKAAAPDSSLLFLLVGAAVLIPIILTYTAYSYWVFRGKVHPDDGYH